jgi:hypothetical protein
MIYTSLFQKTSFCTSIFREISRTMFFFLEQLSFLFVLELSFHISFNYVYLYHHSYKVVNKYYLYLTTLSFIFPSSLLFVLADETPFHYTFVTKFLVRVLQPRKPPNHFPKSCTDSCVIVLPAELSLLSVRQKKKKRKSKKSETKERKQ